MNEPAPMFLPNLLGCRLCPLSEHRTRVVPGFGNHKARLMIVGQSPGEEEDIKGRPLVGNSGRELAHHLKSMGVDLDRDCFRTNVNHCHPKDNREATPAEMRACRPFLDAEIEQCDPVVILAMGSTALKTLLPGESTAITQVRGHVYERVILGKTRYIIPTIHPAFVLRNPKAYTIPFRADLRKAVEIMRNGTYRSAALPFRTTPATLAEIQDAMEAPIFGFDLETDTGSGADDDGNDDENDQGMRGARIIGVGVCAEPGNGLYYPFEDDVEAMRVTLSLSRALESSDHLKIVSNAKFERHILHGYGINLQNWHDTLLMAWVLGDYPLGLKDGFHQATGIEMQRIDTFYKAGFKRKDARSQRFVVDLRAAQDADFMAVAKYAAQDPDASLRLYYVLRKLLEQRNLWDLYATLEVPFNDIIVECERNGFLFDQEALADAEQSIRTGLQLVDERIVTMLDGERINPNSWQQVQRALYIKDTPYRIPKFKETKRQRPMPTDKVSLAPYSSNPLVRDILTYKAIIKMLGTYIEALPRWQDKAHRIHGEYKQAAVSTGRLSSANPNMTNIPARKRDDLSVDVDGSLIRRGFVAPEGHTICAIDLSQIEMRVAAHLSGDPDMIRELGPGGDIHSNTARTIYKTTEEAVGPVRWKEMRNLAKTIGFGSLYGLAAPGLLKRTPTLGLTLTEAQQFIDGFYATYPELRRWQQAVVRFAQTNGYAETILGRRRYFPEITSKDYERRGEAERGAINHPVQGSAADFFKIAVLNVYRFLAEQESAAKIVGLVHDELVLEAPDGEVEWLYEHVPNIMANAIELKVPVFVDFEFGRSWGTVKGPEKQPFPARTR